MADKYTIDEVVEMIDRASQNINFKQATGGGSQNLIQAMKATFDVNKRVLIDALRKEAGKD